MKTRTRWTVALALLAAAAALAWAFAPRPALVETAAVEVGRFEQSVEEEGRTRLHEVYRVTAPLAARLVRIELREGDPVKAGQALAVLRPVLPPLQDARSAEQAGARLKAAQAAVLVAQARLERARVGEAQAQAQSARSERLAREGFLGGASLENDRLAVSAARREVEAAQAEREVVAQEQVAAAAALAPVRAQAAGPDLVLRAPAAGVVLRIPSRSEATLAPGALVIEVGDPQQVEVIAPLLTTDAMTIRPSGPAVIERWGGPPVLGRVRRVEPAAFTQVSALGIEEQRVNVLVDIEAPPAQWAGMGDGFRVHVRLVTASADGAVLVPVGALFARSEGATGVFVLEDGRARLRTVALGGRNNRMAWVREGLRGGERVILYPPPKVADGARVRERRP